MTRVTQADQAIMLLRAQLERIGRARSSQKGSRAGRAAVAGKKPLERVRELAALGALSDEQFGDALIHNLLAEQFGEKLANEAAFIGLGEDVTRLLRSDAETGALLDQVVREMRTA